VNPPRDAEQELQALLDAVTAEPWAHDFFMLLRRIDALRPAQPRTGHALRPAQETLRLAQAPELDFAPAELAHLQRRPQAAAPHLAVRFFGLLGPQGPMPLHITEYVRERLAQHKDGGIAHFLDLFHHRLLTLFHRAWAQAQAAVHLDRPQDDRYRAWLGAVSGQPAGAQPGALPGAALAFQAGLLAGRSRHAEGLCKALTQYFGVPVAVEPHVGRWLAIDPRDRSHLGYAANRAERTQKTAASLGSAANAGVRAWDRQYRFRLHIGPLTRAQYDAFLPGGSAWKPLAEWVRLLAGDEMRWELQLTLLETERPPPRLGQGLRLGVASWLAQGKAGRREPRPLRIRPETSFLLRQP